jgi:hypothetical protein
MITWKQALAKHGTKPYRPSRQIVRLLDGPFAGEITYIDDLSSRITAPIKIGNEVGYYHYAGPVYPKGATASWRSL